MTNESKRSWLKALVPLGIGIAAGIGCCALPLLAGLGIGAVSLGGAAAFLEPLAAVSIGIGAAVSAGLLFTYVHHRRKAANHMPGASCSADGSCGCGPRSKIEDAARAGSSAETVPQA
jgi:hypothetical protein